MEEKREAPRYNFEFFVLEHRPVGHEHPQASRVLRCLDFSTDGMRLSGRPRFDRFMVTLSMPQDGSRVQAEVQVVHRRDDSFGVRFVKASREVVEKLAWWGTSDPGRSEGSVV